MKKTKRFAAAVAAMAMALSMATMTAFASSTPAETTYSISISNGANDYGTHTYKYAQIFTGTVNENGEISKAEFGSGITAANLYSALNDFSAVEGYNNLSAESKADDFIAFMSKIPAADADKLARAIKNIASTTALDDNTKVPAGYYLIVDADTSPTAANPVGANNGAKTAFILKVVKNTALSETAKAAAPTVDKEVMDNDDDVAEGFDNGDWGETADHNINEQFQFKLKATIPNDTNIAKYKVYTLRFTDTLGKGVVFESIDSVKIGNTVITDYVLSDNAKAGLTDAAWTLTINDLKTAESDIAGKDVVVVYNAHLDENAKVAGTKEDHNDNKVKLEYSNNPNYTGKGGFDNKPGEDDDTNEDNTPGKTPEDTVFVYTYKINNEKVDKANHEIKLKDAEFNIKKGNEVLKFTLKTVGGKQVYVYDQANGSETVKSLADGTFNIIGLDAGSYTITETKAPDDYNLNSTDVTVEIIAKHKEESTDEPTLDLKITNDGSFVHENAKGATLPETGGIGTTMFYVGGGVLAAAAGTILIAKKRSKKEEQ